MSISGIVLFVLILLVLVLIHEFGHFITAKLVGMRVDEFAFGFPPRLFSKKKGETTYSINALPFGGYVSIYGENGEPDDVAKHDVRAFGNRPWWAQILVLIAGVTMNLFLAWVIFVALSYGAIAVSVNDQVYGKQTKDRSLVVTDAFTNSPAYSAGIVPGSVIVSMESNGTQASLLDANAVVSFVAAHQNSAIHIVYRDPRGVAKSTTIAAVYGIIPDKKAIGLSFDVKGTYHADLKDALEIGSITTYTVTRDTVMSVALVITSLSHGTNIIPSLSGPIGIAKLVGKSTSYGYEAVLTLVAMLSVNLAVLNILPLPALDGGRTLVVLGETLFRRKVKTSWLVVINAVGFSLIILLTILVMIHDLGY